MMSVMAPKTLVCSRMMDRTAVEDAAAQAAKNDGRDCGLLIGGRGLPAQMLATKGF
jgi:hypothetical protein